jgi:hypothetical protein
MQDKLEVCKISNFLTNFKLNETDIIERKSLVTEMVIDPTDERCCIAKVSTINPDRDNDILIPAGADYQDYLKNPIVIWNHIYSSPPIGKIEQLQIKPDAIYGKIRFADTEFAQEIWSLVKGGFLRTCSIGFIAKEALIAGTQAFKDYVITNNMQISNLVKRIITKFIMIENSIVSIPSNQDALIMAVATKSIHLEDKLIKDLGITIKAEEVPKEIEKIVEPVKVEELVKVEEPIKPIWNVIRSGPYVLTEQDKLAIKKIKSGKIA